MAHKNSGEFKKDAARIALTSGLHHCHANPLQSSC
jgi:hypothetical protein